MLLALEAAADLLYRQQRAHFILSAALPFFSQLIAETPREILRTNPLQVTGKLTEFSVMNFATMCSKIRVSNIELEGILVLLNVLRHTGLNGIISMEIYWKYSSVVIQKCSTPNR